MIFNPFEEPEDKYGINAEPLNPFQDSIAFFCFLAAIIPVFGPLYLVGVIFIVRLNGSDNEFNIDNYIWNWFVIGTVVNLFIYLPIYLIFFM